MSTLRINGQVRQFPADEMPATVAALLATLKIEPGSIVAELDGRIVPPGEFGRTALADGQAIELVKYMGGG